MSLKSLSIALASVATTRKRVYERYAMDTSDIDRIAKDVAAIRTAAYEQRLRQLGKEMSIAAKPELTDKAVLKRIVRESRDSAASIVTTHNRQLAVVVKKQSKDATQRELGASVREWEAKRAPWKSKQIAMNEGMAARNQADADIISKNGWSKQLKVRVAPQKAQEPQCQALIGAGWMEWNDVFFTLPLHSGCPHGFEYQQHFGTLASAKRESGEEIWLG